MFSDASVTRLGSGLYASCDAFETGCIHCVLYTRHVRASSVGHAPSVQLVVGCMVSVVMLPDCPSHGRAPMSAVVCCAAVIAAGE